MWLKSAQLKRRSAAVLLLVQWPRCQATENSGGAGSAAAPARTPSPQTHVWSPQALLRVPWWHALRQQPPLDLSQGSGKRHLVHTSHQRRGSELSPPVSKGQCWGHPSEGAGGSRLGQAACAGAGPRQRCLSTAPIYFCEPWPWRSPEAAAQHGGRLGLLHALPDAGTRPKAGRRQGMRTRVWQQRGRLLTQKRNKTNQHVAYWSAPSLPCDCTTCTSYISERGATSPYCDGFLKFKSFTCY